MKRTLDPVEGRFAVLEQKAQSLSSKANSALVKNPGSRRALAFSSFLNNSSALLTRSGIAQKLGKSFANTRDIYSACGYPKTLVFDDYAARYFRQDIAKRVVNAYPEATWRRGPAIYETEDDAQTDFEKKVKRIFRTLKIQNFLLRLDKIAGIGRYGVMLLGFNDSKTLQTEVKRATELKFLQIYSEKDAEIFTLDRESTSPRYGQPLQYKINVGTSADGVTLSNQKEEIVHHSRILHVAEGLTSGEVYGSSRLEAIYNRLQDVELVMAGSAEMFWRGGYPGLSFEAPSDADIDQSMDDLEDEIEDYIHGLNRYLRLIGLQTKQLLPVIADPSPHVEIQLQAISAGTGIPKRILTGSERGELASSQDDDNWMQRVSERRGTFAEQSILRPFIDRLITVGVLPPVKNEDEGEEVFGYSVEWPDANSVTKKEQVTNAKTEAEAIATYVNSGSDAVVSPYHFLSLILGWSDEEIESNMNALDERAEEEAEETVETEETVPPVEEEDVQRTI